jgi:nucleoside-diphosphate-sugar epimerase
MRVFLTGATGYVGSAVLESLVRGGHQVHALVRNADAAARVQARGATAVLGDVMQPASWRAEAAAADGAIHTAAQSGAKARPLDETAVGVLISLPAKANRFVIYTSSMWVLGPAPAPVDETAPLNPIELVSWRPAQEKRILASASSGGRAIVIRPGTLYGGCRGIVGDLMQDAANSLVRIVGNGKNHWPLVYDRDLGELYARIVNTPTAAGVYHANDGGDETVNDIVAALGEHAHTRPSIRHVPLPEARKKMGPSAEALALDQLVRSRRARSLGWAPTLHSVAGNVAGLFEEWKRGKAA